MKVLYLTNSIPQKDNKVEGIFVLRRIEELIKLNFEVEVIYINTIIKNNFKIKYLKGYNFQDIGFDINVNVKIFNDIKLPKIGSLTNVLRRLSNYYKLNNFDLIHAQFLDWGFIANKLKNKFGLPYVITAHGSDIHTAPYDNSSYMRRAIKTLKEADKVIFVSEYLKNEASKFCTKDINSITIGNGVESKYFDNYSISNQGNILGFIGNLVEVKRVELLLDVVFEVKKSIKYIKFLIIGDGPEKKFLLKKVESLGLSDNVAFVGRVHPDLIKDYLQKISILLFISKKEGFGCVIIEAHARGTLVLGSNNGAIPEVIGNDNFIVDDNDELVLNLSKKILYYMENGYNADELRNNALKYTWKNTILKEIEVYNSVLEEINT